MATKDPSDTIIIIRRNLAGDEVCDSGPISLTAYANVLSNVNTSGLSSIGGIALTAMESVE